MKTRTMNAVIQKKINDWLSSIDDPLVVKQIRNDIVVTGGCITSMLLNEDINDFDVYLKTKKSVKMLAEYYTNKFNQKVPINKSNKVYRKLHAWVLDGADLELWKQDKKNLSSFAYDYKDVSYSDVSEWNYDTLTCSDEEKNEFLRSHLKLSGMIMNTDEDRIKIIINSDGIAEVPENSDSIADSNEYDINGYLDALSDGDVIDANQLEEVDKYKVVFLSTNAITLSNKVQIVTRFYGDPKVIHSNYDFIHTTNYWDSATGKTTLNQDALECILNKDLQYIGSKYPIASLIRTRKFIKRGWNINAGQYVKMAFQISELDLSNIYTLEDQLVGVDSIYFLNFIEQLKRQQAMDKTFNFDRQYLTTVIDKVFG